MLKTFNVISKGRKYFQATIDTHKCRLLIDTNSRDLPLGEQELDVEDVSVRSKWGTDLIFKLTASPEAVKEAGIVTLKHPMYNANLRETCLKLGGKWDSQEHAWVFSGIVADQVEALDEEYNSPLIPVELTAKYETYGYHGPVFFCGIPLAEASGRDSGAKLREGVSLIKGEVTSGGSMKNWRTYIGKGTVLRLQVPETLLEQYEARKDDPDFTVTRL